MRGPAPSIVCPRCGLVAPPADGVGKFTTCLKCGLSFDASARERAPSPARRPPLPARASDPPPKPPSAPALSPLRVVGILVALGVAGTIKYEYSWQTKPERDALEALDRANREEHQARMRQLEAIRAQPMPKTGVEACDRITDLVVHPAACPDPAAASQVKAALDHAMLAMGSAASAVAGCTAVLAEVSAIQARLGCK